MGFFESLAHYFYPRYSNNHKAKILHSSSLLMVSLLLVVYQFLLNVFPIVGVNILGYAANISTDEVIRLTNEKRTQSGVGALRYNSQLAQAARAKAEHMLQHDYWAHVAPDGTEPWKFFTNVSYRYRYAGENLARDFTNPASTVDAWMASPSHKENLLSTKYVDIGVAVVEGDLGGIDTTIVVQLFGTPLDGNSQVAAVAARPVATATPKPTGIPTIIIDSTISVAPTATITLSPTQTPTQVPVIENSGSINELPPVTSEANAFKVLISPFQTTRGISIALTSVLLTVLLIDAIVVARRRLTRVGGRTFAHLAFFGMILTILLIAKVGQIL